MKLFDEIIAEHSPNMGKEYSTKSRKAQRVPGRINSRCNTLRHTVITVTKVK